MSLPATCVFCMPISVRKIDSSLPIRVRLLFCALYILQCLKVQSAYILLHAENDAVNSSHVQQQHTSYINKMIDTI